MRNFGDKVEQTYLQRSLAKRGSGQKSLNL